MELANCGDISHVRHRYLILEMGGWATDEDSVAALGLIHLIANCKLSNFCWIDLYYGRGHSIDTRDYGRTIGKLVIK